LLSVWPNELTFAPGDPVARIETIVPLDQVKVIDFVGYAPNPPDRYRNQIARTRRTAAEPDRPKFRSEQERESGRTVSGAAAASGGQGGPGPHTVAASVRGP